MNFEVLALIFLFLWTCALTFFSTRMILHYNALTKGADKKNLKPILDTLLEEIHGTKKDIVFLKNQCDKIEKEGLYHIQKVGLLRFNPFKDTGGDQSFILALIDGNDTGVVISGLYSRSGTRWYAKKIKEGNGLEHDLSDEEKKTIREAKRISDI